MLSVRGYIPALLKSSSRLALAPSFSPVVQHLLKNPTHNIMDVAKATRVNRVVAGAKVLTVHRPETQVPVLNVLPELMLQEQIHDMGPLRFQSQWGVSPVCLVRLDLALMGSQRLVLWTCGPQHQHLKGKRILDTDVRSFGT